MRVILTDDAGTIIASWGDDDADNLGVLEAIAHELGPCQAQRTLAARIAESREHLRRASNSPEHLAHARAARKPRCPWTSAEECRTAAERAVAGTDQPIPGCRVHPHPEEE